MLLNGKGKSDVSERHKGLHVGQKRARAFAGGEGIDDERWLNVCNKGEELFLQVGDRIPLHSYAIQALSEP